MRWVILLIGVLWLASCGDPNDPRSSGGGAASVGFTATLAQLGSALTWTGGVISAVAFAARILLWSSPFGRLISGVVFAGLAITANGVFFEWLAVNAWILVVGTIASLVVSGVLWWYWPRLHRAVARRLVRTRTVNA